MKWNFQHVRRCTTINNPHAHNNYRDPLQTTMKRKIRIQLVRGMNPVTTNKNTMQSSQEQTRSTIKKHTDTGTQRFRPRKWCQNDTTNRSRRNHLRNCLRKKPSRSDYIIDTQTKNAMTQESLRKKMTNRTLARTTGLPPRPHLHQRHHETNAQQIDEYQPRPTEKQNARNGRF